MGFYIKLGMGNMVVKIACTKCRGDMVRYDNTPDAIGKKLICIPCDNTSFYAYHSEEGKIEKVRKKIKDIKTNYKKAGYVQDPETFEEIINNLGKDFEAIFQ